MNVHESLVSILRQRSATEPHRLAFRFLPDGETDACITMSYRELDRKAASLARKLKYVCRKGDRALLFCRPGMEFIQVFMGCLYAGVIAVPAYPPHPARLRKTYPVVRNIFRDAAPRVVIGDDNLFHAIDGNPELKAEFHGTTWISTEEADEGTDEDNTFSPAGKNDIAFLQYSSGSTGNPKGVMVTHGNLLANLAFIEKSFKASPDSRVVLWLPPYHDMGLIGGLLQSIYTGFPLTFMPHLAFLQRPARWLEAISHYQATVSGAPNFAYELCVNKVSEEQRERLDLSHWRVAFNGAEKVFPETLERFSAYFEPAGFSKKSFTPCYGLAEATLLVTGMFRNTEPPVLKLSPGMKITEMNGTTDVASVAGCGPVQPEAEVRIVNPETRIPCPDDETGEVWVTGGSVSRGYWNNPEATKKIFAARLATSDDPRDFLRTGDLGCIRKGELYITGRIRDLIICAGLNYHPADIENTVMHANASVNGCAAFAVTLDQEERLVLLVESQSTGNDEEVKAIIRREVMARHEIYPYDILLVRIGQIARTTSGKIRRYLCKQKYLNEELQQLQTL